MLILVLLLYGLIACIFILFLSKLHVIFLIMSRETVTLHVEVAECNIQKTSS